MTLSALDRIRQLMGSQATTAADAARVATPMVRGADRHMHAPKDETPLERVRRLTAQGQAASATDPLSRLPSPVGGAIRGLAATLEPLALPQDAFFAMLAGAVDPNTTIAERLRRIQVKDYLPYGDAPERPADGQEILTLMGFSESIAKWGGIAADLTVDPLVFGSWLRIAGKVSKSAELVNLGNRVDRLMSPGGLLTDANRFARRSEGYRNFQDSRMQSLFDALRNPESNVFGIQRFGHKATRVLDFMLPQDAMFNIRFGEEVGSQLARAKRQADLTGRNVTNHALVDLQRTMYGMDGEAAKKMVSGVLEAMDEHAIARRGILGQIDNPLVREAIDTSVYKLNVDQQGVGLVAFGGRIPTRLDPDGRLADLGVELRSALAAGYEGGQTHNAEQLITEFLERRFENAITPRRNNIIELAGEEAKKSGLAVGDIEKLQRQAAEAFDQYLAATTTLDARIGRHTSGYDFVAENIRKRGLELGASMEEIDNIFRTVLRTGLLKGQKGIEELWDTATTISVRTPGKHSQAEVMRRAEDYRVRANAVRGYTGELNSFKESLVTTAKAPASKARFTSAVEEARAVRDADVADYTRWASEQVEEARFVADSARERNAELLQKWADDTELGRISRTEAYVDLLFGGHRGLVGRAQNLSEATMKLSPQRLGRAITGNELFTALPEASRRLRDANLQYQAMAEEIVMLDRITTDQATKFIRAEKEVLDLVTEQEANLAKFSELVQGAVQAAGNRGPSNTLKTLRDQVAAWQQEAKDLRFLLEQSRARKVGGVGDIRAAERVNREANESIARGIRADTRNIVRETQAAMDEARTIRDRGKAEARAEFARTEQRLRAEHTDAVQEAQARTAAARASMEAEYEALGRGKPGSAADRRYVAKHAAGVPEPQLIQRADPIALDGTNPSRDEIISARLEAARDEVKRGARVDPEAGIIEFTEEAIEELLEAPITYGELLRGISQMQALPLGEYLEGLMNGHLRKAYGLFIDGTNFQHYIDKVRRGSIMSGHLVDEMNLRQIMPNMHREADLISAYHKALVDAGGGVVLRKNGIMRYLKEHGVSDANANAAIEAMVRSLNSNPLFHTSIDILIERQGMYRDQIQAAQRIASGSDTPMVANRRFFQERVDLPEVIATALGEHAQASLSIAEGASVANRVVARQEFTQRAYTIAREQGLIKDAPFVNQYGTRYVPLGDGDNVMGGFAGKYVHPYLVEELRRLSNVESQFLGAGFQRLRALITGGYLAAPSVIAANFMGGFYQAATAGINPVVMARRMAEVLPDMVKAARGESTELIESIRRYLDLEMSSLVGSEMAKDFRRLVNESIEMSPEGMRKFADNAARVYEDFLQRPGIGRFRVAFAGLEGFQFSENWFKVAAFKEMREYLTANGAPAARGGARTKLTPAQIDEMAAEYARTVVFDYSQLPIGLEKLKQTGVIMFPGFAYFMASRTLGAALNRPGTLAVADRLSEAVANAVLDPLDQITAYLGMPEWLREEQGTPLPFSFRAGSGGNDQVSMIPFAQLVPTATVWDSLGGRGLGANPWAESISQLGMWGPIVDIVTALVSGEGDATITARFGHKVFDAGAEGGEKAADVFRFLYNTMAPSMVRRGISLDYQDQPRGFLPALGEMMGGLGTRMPGELARSLYTFEERRTNRPERTWREDIVASFLRTPTVIALEGPMVGIRSEMEKARNAMNEEITVLTAKYHRALDSGQAAAAERYRARIEARRAEFNDLWREYLTFYRANDLRRKQRRQVE